VNQVKYERPVKEAFENAMIVVDEPKAKYVYFDFHKECKGMRFDRVNVLVDQLREGLDEEGSVKTLYRFPQRLPDQGLIM
jgi:hypothetical protein